MYRILEYSDNYKEQVIDLWIDICVNEFGFHDWEPEINSIDNSLYRNNGENFWIAINNNDNLIATIAIQKISNEICELKRLYVKKRI